MTMHFNRHLDGLDLTFWCEMIMRHGSLVTVDRGELICRKGEPTVKFGLVETGYFRYEVGDPLRIAGFAFAGALVGDYPGVQYAEPANCDISAGKRSTAWIMDATVLPRLADTDIVVARNLRMLSEQAYRSLLYRYNDMYTLSPADRYRRLLECYPRLMQEVSLKEIASYLCISQVHLCRIRKELLRE